MTKRIFEPVISTFLTTDGVNHDSSVEFKISYGYELENPNAVFKVQMVGNGYIKGRQAPSYSDNKIKKIIVIKDKLKSEFNSMDKRIRDELIEFEGLTNKESQF
mgnify:CR=1 FL=1